MAPTFHILWPTSADINLQFALNDEICALEWVLASDRSQTSGLAAC